MRNEVEINGVKLTRAQLEDGLKRMNEPEVERPMRGDVFASENYSGAMKFLAIGSSGLAELLTLIKNQPRLELCVDESGVVHTFDPKLHVIKKKKGTWGW